jgi:hypothetical protein
MGVSKCAEKRMSMRLGLSENQLQATSFMSGLIAQLSRERRQHIYNPKTSLSFLDG